MKNFNIIFSCLILLMFWKSNSYGQELPKKAPETIIEGRPVDLQGCLNVHDTVLVINYWDCAIEDNDTISLNLNGQWILQRIRLTNAKKELRINVKPGENFLTLYAHNLGDLPNNTAAFSVREQYANQEVSMSSNLLVSGTTRIACYIGNPAVLMNTLPPCVKKEVNTAAADDVKNEIKLYEDKIAQANKPQVIQTSNPPRQTSTPRRQTRTHYPAGGTINLPKPSKTPDPKPAPAPEKKSPEPTTNPTPAKTTPRDW